MLNEKQKEQLESVINKLKEKGAETYEEVILCLDGTLSKAADLLKTKNKELETVKGQNEILQEDNKSLLDEN